MTPTELYLEAIQGRTDIIVATTDAIALLLADAADKIRALLLRQPTDYQRWYLPSLANQVRLQLADVGTEAASVVVAAEGHVWKMGEVLVDDTVKLAGINVPIVRIDTAQLTAMRAFSTERINGITLQAANDINTQIGRVIIGGQTPFEAVQAVAGILEDATLKRASTTVFTNLAQAHSTATQLRMESLADDVPELQKKWIKSGKREPRPAHVAINGQTKSVSEPFVLRGGAVKMMYPHDPAAPAAEVINCGCISVPVVPDTPRK